MTADKAYWKVLEDHLDVTLHGWTSRRSALFTQPDGHSIYLTTHLRDKIMELVNEKHINR